MLFMICIYWPLSHQINPQYSLYLAVGLKWWQRSFLVNTSPCHYIVGVSKCSPQLRITAITSERCHRTSRVSTYFYQTLQNVSRRPTLRLAYSPTTVDIMAPIFAGAVLLYYVYFWMSYGSWFSSCISHTFAVSSIQVVEQAI